MNLCMFIRDYKPSEGGVHYIFMMGGSEFDYLSIDKLAEGFKKQIKPDFRGEIPVMWDIPSFLGEAVTNVALRVQYGESPPTFIYRMIDPEDRKRINDSLPEGIELKLE